MNMKEEKTAIIAHSLFRAKEREREEKPKILCYYALRRNISLFCFQVKMLFIEHPSIYHPSHVQSKIKTTT